MKRFSFRTLLAAALLSAPAQADLIQTYEPQIVNKGPHERTWQTISLDRDENGIETLRTNAFVEVASGLNRWDDQSQDWVEASDEIEVINGVGVARKAQHKVIFAANVNDVQGSIDLTMPDGNRLVIQCIGLAYTESDTGRSVFIAETKNSIGQMTARNTIVYPDAFDFVKADIVAQVRREAFEHDVVLKEKIPGPETFGLNPLTAKLEVWHQILSSPSAKTETGTIKRKNGGDDADDKVDFGSMRLGEGAAFPLADQTVNLGGGSDEAQKVRVAREWIKLDGFDFLIESVPYQESKPQIDDLPVQAEARQINRKKIDKAFAQVQKGRRGKPVSVAKLMDWKREEKPKAFASIHRAETTKDRGYVLDYVTVSTGVTNYTWQSDTTYFVTGPVSCSGTSTAFEGGVVIKYFSTNNNAGITVNTPIVWTGSMYRPVVLTARDNHGAGDPIGTAAITNTAPYAATALDIGTNVVNLDHLRVTHAQVGLKLNGSTGAQINNAQFLYCSNGVQVAGADFAIRNALFAHITNTLSGSGSITGTVEHVTVSEVTWFNQSNQIATLNVANSLLVAVGTAGSYSGTSVSTATNTNGIFQAKGNGYYYLAGDTYRNVGSTNLSATTLGILKTTTTIPPVELTNDFAVSTVLYPTAQRDTDVPDLGFHYDALDYLWTGLRLTNSTLTLTNGTAVAFYGTKGLTMDSGAKFTSQGTPSRLNRFVRYNTVQEQAVALGATASGMSVFYVTTTASPAVEFRARFTGVSVLGASTSLRTFIDHNSYQTFSLVQLTDCELTSPYLSIYLPSSPSYTLNVALTNNLLLRPNFYFEQGYVGNAYAFGLKMQNNTFDHGTIGLLCYTNTPAWTVKNNFFNTVSLSDSSTNGVMANSNNGYKSTSALSGTGGNKTVNTVDYQSGSLGNYYYPTSGTTNLFILVDNGSGTTSTNALFHYTTRVDNTKDSGTVDIGFHYVAVDSNGQPLDSDGDGIPDYLEDLNGNGTTETGETDWQAYTSSSGLSSGTPGIDVYTPLLFR